MANLKEIADSRTALLWFRPDQLKVMPGLNGRDMTTPENAEHIAALAELIAANGFMQSKPLEIFTEGEQVYISDGGCRFAAVQLLASRGVVVDKLPCVPEPRYTNDADRILNQSVNNSGKRFSAIEEGGNIKRAHALGKTVAQIAAKLGKSLTYVNQALDFQAAPAEVHALVNAGEISATLAAKTIRREGNAAGTATIKKAVAEAKASGKAKATEKTVAKVTPAVVHGAITGTPLGYATEAAPASQRAPSEPISIGRLAAMASAGDALREAAQAVVDAWGDGTGEMDDAIVALRAALSL